MKRRDKPLRRSSRTPRQARLLVTGFGPFPGVAVNPSAAIATRLAEAARRSATAPRITAVAVPTHWEAPQVLVAEARAMRPDAVVHLGVAARSRRLRIEMLASDRAVAARDAAGLPPKGRSISGGRRSRIAAGYDPARLLAAARAAGPVELSRDAGGYICNATFFASLDAPAAPVVAFLHVPLPGRRRGARLEDLARQVEAALRVIAAMPRGGGPPRRSRRS